MRAHPRCCQTKERGIDRSTVAQSTSLGDELTEAWFWVAARPFEFPKFGWERMEKSDLILAGILSIYLKIESQVHPKASVPI
jgi:hypothetical protein